MHCLEEENEKFVYVFSPGALVAAAADTHYDGIAAAPLSHPTTWLGLLPSYVRAHVSEVETQLRIAGGMELKLVRFISDYAEKPLVLPDWFLAWLLKNICDPHCNRRRGK